jgi:hypothetical protein
MVIGNLSSKEIETVNGPAKVFHFRDAVTNVWYDSFAASWNSEWADGTELEIVPSQVRIRTKGDRQYLTLMAPAKPQSTTTPAKPAAAPIQRMDPQAIGLLQTIVRELREIRALLASGREPEEWRERGGAEEGADEPEGEPGEQYQPAGDDAGPDAGFGPSVGF